MHTVKQLLLLLTLSGLATCASNHTRRYDGATVSAYTRLPLGYRVIPGKATVLELSEYRSIPLPDAISGYTLLLETDSTRLRPNALFHLPDSSMATFLAVLRAPSSDTTTDIVGRVRVLRITNQQLEVDFQLSAPTLKWSYSGRAKLLSTPASCFGRDTRYVRLKGNAGCT